ncbi:MAG: lipoprotein [Gammaproteobacteria bacterium]
MPATTLRVIAFCLLLALLSACGQKGDLYLPDEPAAADVEDDDRDA